MAFVSVGPLELAVIAVIALLVLGPSRLPEAARALGKGMRELKESFNTDPADEPVPKAHDEDPDRDYQPAP